MKRKPTRIIYYTYFVSHTISYIYHNTAIKFIHFKRKIQEYQQSLIIKKKINQKESASPLIQSPSCAVKVLSLAMCRLTSSAPVAKVGRASVLIT